MNNKSLWKHLICQFFSKKRYLKLKEQITGDSLDRRASEVSAARDSPVGLSSCSGDMPGPDDQEL